MNPLKRRLNKIAFLTRLYHPPQAGLKYRLGDLNYDYYARIKGDRELEHQIGRLTNFQQIISEMAHRGIHGDFIEFGSFQGFSLLWIAYLMQRASLTRAVVGIDSFSGLPNSEGVFSQGQFNNTSLKICRENIMSSDVLSNFTKASTFIFQNKFSEKDTILQTIKLITSSKFGFIHIDCDISSAVREVFSILVDGDLLADTCYLLFDDYGVMESYKNTVDELIAGLKGFTISEHSKTNLTKNYLLTRS